MDITELDKYFAKMTIGLKKQMAGHLPRKIGNIAVLMFKENFQRESFFGRTWRDVKRRIHGEKGAAGKRKILTGPTGNLGRSIQSVPKEGAVDIISDLPYSEAHNEGTSNAGRAHNVRIPQRQFIGDNEKLRDAINKKIEEELSKIIK